MIEGELWKSVDPVGDKLEEFKPIALIISNRIPSWPVSRNWSFNWFIGDMNEVHHWEELEKQVTCHHIGKRKWKTSKGTSEGSPEIVHEARHKMQNSRGGEALVSQ